MTVRNQKIVMATLAGYGIVAATSVIISIRTSSSFTLWVMSALLVVGFVATGLSFLQNSSRRAGGPPSRSRQTLEYAITMLAVAGAGAGALVALMSWLSINERGVNSVIGAFGTGLIIGAQLLVQRMMRGTRSPA